MNDKYLLRAIGSWLKQQRKANLCWCPRCQFSFLNKVHNHRYLHLRFRSCVPLPAHLHRKLSKQQEQVLLFLVQVLQDIQPIAPSVCASDQKPKPIKLQRFPKQCNSDFDWRYEEIDKFGFNSIKWLAMLFMALDEEAPIWASQLPTCVENRANIPLVVALNPSQPESIGALCGSDPMKRTRRPSRLNTIHIMGTNKRHRITI